MTIPGIGTIISPVIQSVLDTRRQLDDLQRQLGTGQKADTFAGLGPQAGLATGLSAQLAAIGGFNDTIATVGTRISLAQTILTQVSDVGNRVQTATLLPTFKIDNTGQTN